jgi:uncharacterized protein
MGPEAVALRGSQFPARGASLDFRGIGLYVFLTFGLTWTADFIMIARGVRFDKPPIWALAVLAGTMWFPAISAYAVRRWVTHEGFGDAGMRIGPWRIYLVILIAAPLVFMAVYLSSWMLGTAHLDVTLSNWWAQVRASLGPTIPNEVILPAPRVLLSIVLISSVSIGPLQTALLTFGEEFGWTGYLLPKLLPLGKWGAAVIYGLIWGLWHGPIIAKGYNYPGHPSSGVPLMALFTIALALIQASLRLRYKSVLLTTWLHACANAQGHGIFPMLFAVANPLWGGITSVIGIAVTGVIGVILLRRSPRTEN